MTLDVGGVHYASLWVSGDGGDTGMHMSGGGSVYVQKPYSAGCGRVCGVSKQCAACGG